jgi:hypothetical protein
MLVSFSFAFAYLKMKRFYFYSFDENNSKVLLFILHIKVASVSEFNIKEKVAFLHIKNKKFSFV